MKEQNFNNWNELKKDLHFNQKRNLHIKEREIYFLSVGQNIGYESLGKGKYYLRPIIVFKKTSKDTFIGIPLTSKEKEGSYYFQFQYKNDKISTALLNQIRIFDIKRIKYYSGNIKAEDFNELKQKLATFFKITPPLKEGGGILTKSEQRKENIIIAKKSLIVKIPNNNLNERKYILDIIFNEFLGIDYKMDIEQRENYEIILENGKKLIIEDHFFSKFPKDLEYLKKENIPQKIEFAKNDFIVEDDIPVIYGTNRLINNNQSNTITCGIDIFASSFFMLTRWEEYVNKNRDIHNRFPATESLVYKFNFLDRPVVNEYVEMLKNMLLKLESSLSFKRREFQLFLTHDVDHCFRYENIKSCFYELGGDLVKRKNYKLFFKNIYRQIKVFCNFEKDPYDTYDYLMNISERSGVKSYFFLHSSKKSSYDNKNKNLKKVIENILKRGHFIGYHPSYNAYNNFELFINDKKEIEREVKQALKFGRAHYLRFEIPTTWQIWEDAKMEWDSSLGYADREGFRCGVCYEYSVFNVLTRKKLQLKEKPLIVMEGSIITYQSDIEPVEMENKIRNLIKIVKKYNGEFVFLWHNSSFNTMQWREYQHIYNEVLS